jgi:hypothetical protein
VKEVEARGIVSLGTSDSFSIETSSARWSSLETRLRKASWSSSEAGDGVSVLIEVSL